MACLGLFLGVYLGLSAHGYLHASLISCAQLPNHFLAVSMTVETLPHFTAPAAKLWRTIQPDTRKLLLSNVWCGKCRREVTITNFSGAVRGGDLLLVGRCAECQGDVARVIESG